MTSFQYIIPLLLEYVTQLYTCNKTLLDVGLNYYESVPSVRFSKLACCECLLLQPGSQDALHRRPRLNFLPDPKASTLQTFQDTFPHSLLCRRPTHASRAHSPVQYALCGKSDRQANGTRHGGRTRVSVRHERRSVYLLRAAARVARNDLVV